MAIWKFNDYQALTGATVRGDIKPNTTVKNGYIGTFDVTNGVFRQITTGEDVGEIWIVGNIIDKPETLNTDDFELTTDDYVRIFKLDDVIGKRIEIQDTMVSTAFADVAVGDILIPEVDAWTFVERTAEIGSYITLTVKKKTTLGTFTIDGSGNGGYICEVQRVTLA